MRNSDDHANFRIMLEQCQNNVRIMLEVRRIITSGQMVRIIIVRLDGK